MRASGDAIGLCHGNGWTTVVVGEGRNTEREGSGGCRWHQKAASKLRFDRSSIASLLAAGIASGITDE